MRIKTPEQVRREKDDINWPRSSDPGFDWWWVAFDCDHERLVLVRDARRQRGAWCLRGCTSNVEFAGPWTGDR